jgi:hypothetical protein
MQKLTAFAFYGPRGAARIFLRDSILRDRRVFTPVALYGVAQQNNQQQDY